jgi:hypothetical protein
MSIIRIRLDKANGRILGASIFLNAETIEAFKAYGDTINLNVKSEKGKIILTQAAEAAQEAGI